MTIILVMIGLAISAAAVCYAIWLITQGESKAKNAARMDEIIDWTPPQFDPLSDAQIEEWRLARWD